MKLNIFLLAFERRNRNDEWRRSIDATEPVQVAAAATQPETPITVASPTHYHPPNVYTTAMRYTF